jgi:hypothetical protein
MTARISGYIASNDRVTSELLIGNIVEGIGSDVI